MNVMEYDDEDIPIPLLLALMAPDKPKVFCGVQLRSGYSQRPNHIVANCTREEYHQDDLHVDCHSGAKWR